MKNNFNYPKIIYIMPVTSNELIAILVIYTEELNEN